MPTSRKQSIVSFFVIIVLISIAVAIGIKQQRYSTEDTVLKTNLFIEKLIPTTDIENYSPSNLYEKIDGKADLYLNNGFVSLQWRRYADTSTPDNWAEIYLFELGNPENAFAVYSMQRRTESSPLDWAQFGYATSDAIYAAAGKYYIEAPISSDDSALLNTASAAVKNLISSLSAGKAEIPYINLFPKENLQTQTFKFISADAFGSDLKNVFAADYKINEKTITAYITKDATGEIFDSYSKFLTDNGGTELKIDSKIPQCKAVDLFGTTEIVFRSGQYFAGVRGTAPINDFKQTAEKLFESLSKQK
ncbi:MAG: DUF6599 family protein [Phycisphaerales bacterium]